MTNTAHAWMHSLERWDDLRYFLACAREGSFSAAARVLHVEQSTVSRRIGALERSLGGPLFTRTPEGVLQTPLAAIVAQEAEAIEAHMTTIMSQARGEEIRPVGPVRIALTDSMAIHLILPGLLSMVEKYPDLRYELVTGEDTSDLVRGEAEIALRFFRPAQGDLVAKKVAVFPQFVYAHPDYWEAHKHLEWEQHRWITMHLPFVEVSEHTWFARNLSCPPWLITNSYLSMMHAARLGLGMALMTQSVQLAFPELVAIDVPFAMPPPLELWLTTHRALRRTARISVIWDELEALCGLLGGV